MAMISIHERSEAQYAFRLTVERFLEHETFCSSAHQKSQHAGAHHMRCKAMYSDEVRQDGENSVRQLVKILQQPEPVDESLMQDITALAPAVLSLGLKATAPQLEQASHHFCNELIPKQNLPAELHWKAARLFESVGETGEAAQDLERSANTTFDFLALWRDAADLLGALFCGPLRPEVLKHCQIPWERTQRRQRSPRSAGEAGDAAGRLFRVEKLSTCRICGGSSRLRNCFCRIAVPKEF